MKTVRALVGLLIVVGAIYTAWLVVPAYLHNYQLEDAMGDEARMNTYSAKSEEDMRETIYRKAKDMEMPITRDQVNVKREAQSVNIWVNYTVHVELPGYAFDLQFHPSTKNKAL